MKMLDNRYSVSSRTLSEMEEFLYDLQNAYFQVHLCCVMLDDIFYSEIKVDLSNWRFQSLNTPFSVDAIGRILDSGLYQLRDLSYAYLSILKAISSGDEYNYIAQD